MHKTNALFIVLFFQNAFCMKAPSTHHRHVPTEVIRPHLILYIKPTQVFIGGANGWEIINTETLQPVKQLISSTKQKSIKNKNFHKIRAYDVALNKSKDQFTISTNETMHCYSAETGKYLWGAKHHYSGYVPVTFDSQNKNNVIFCSENGHNNQLQGFYKIKNQNNLFCFLGSTYTPISCHPSSRTILWHTDDTLYTMSASKKTHFVPPLHGNTILDAQYSPDGKNIIVNLAKQLIRCDISSPGNIQYSPVANTTSSFTSFEFYNNNILACLSQDNVIRFYDYYGNNKILTTINLDEFVQKQSNSIGKRLSFLPNGNDPSHNLIVALHNKCFIITISTLDLMYGTEQLFSVFCLLKPFFTTVKNKSLIP